MPVAFAQGNGNWNVTNGSVGDFAGWAATSGVQPLVGDFDNDGRSDVALIRQAAGWATMPVAFAQANGNWNVTNGSVGDFAGWAATSGVQPLVGDFDNDGRSDVALIRQAAGWATMPVAFAQANGNWNVTNGSVGDFAGWAATSGVLLLVDDFDIDDGRSDVALIRQAAGWATMPVAFAQGNGNWNVTNGSVGDFAGWAATSGVQPLVGDFDNDGRSDVALIHRLPAGCTMPVAFAQANGNWNVTNGSVGDFAGWAATSGVQPLVGDFDNDGQSDVALIHRPPAGPPCRSPSPSVNDGSGDVACACTLARSGGVGVFATGRWWPRHRHRSLGSV